MACRGAIRRSVRPHDGCGTVKRFTIRLHPVGALMLLGALLFCPSRDVLAAGLALLWHEGAHLVTMRLCGVCDCRVELTPFGGMADARSFERLSPGRQALSALSGVMGSAAGCLACAALGRNLFWRQLAGYHASLAFVNCLPAWPLDGARALLALAACFGAERGMRKFLQMASALLGACMVGLGLYGAWRGMFNPTLLMAGPYLWYAARNGMVSEKVRRLRMTDQKLQDTAAMPAVVLAAQSNALKAQLPLMVADFPTGRYHLVAALDERGQLERLWTENELLEQALENIPERRDVDK